MGWIFVGYMVGVVGRDANMTIMEFQKVLVVLNVREDGNDVSVSCESIPNLR